MNKIADSRRTCPNCGEVVGVEAPLELCPRCLLAQYLTPTEDSPEDPADSVDTWSVGGGKDKEGRVFGNYDLLDEIGRGGMGVVYRARQHHPDRVVALKMIMPSLLTSATDLQRFHLESETAALLEHPHVLPIHEVGEIAGQPYFTTKYLEGGNLAHRISSLLEDGEKWGREDRVRFFLKVCQAVAYAHSRGVLHRDLKPSNILLDVEGAPCVADFGLARLLETESDLTLSQAMIGTPAYAAPEQLRGGNRHLTMAADVYSLGAVLYELLSGKPPLCGPTTAETVRRVLDEDPKPLRVLAPTVGSDLEAICLKCLEKDPQQRYANAGELAHELERYLVGEPIQARSPDTLSLVWRWCRRRPAVTGLGSAVLLLILAVAVVASIAAFRIALAHESEQREGYYNRIALASSLIEAGDIRRAKEILAECPERFRHWEWGHLLMLCHQEVISIPAHSDIDYGLLQGFRQVVNRVHDIQFSADGSLLATLGSDGSVKVWNSTDGREVFSMVNSNRCATAILFSPTEECLAVLFEDQTVEGWDTEIWKRRFSTLLEGQPPHSLSWSPDGNRIVAANKRGYLVMVARTGEPLTNRSMDFEFESAWFSPNGERLILKAKREARIYDSEGLGELGVIHVPVGEPVSDMFVDPWGRRWVTIDSEGNTTLWQGAESPQRLNTIRGDRAEVRRVFFSKDGQRFCTGGDKGTARVWDAATGRELLSLPDRVLNAEFCPGGRLLITIGGGDTAQVWDLETRRILRALRGHSGIIESLSFSPNGQRAATGCRDGDVKVWASEQGRQTLKERSWTWGMSVSKDGRQIVTAPWGSSEFTIWDADRGQRRLTVDTVVQGVTWSDFSPDGQRLVTIGHDKVGRVWDTLTGALLLELRGHRRCSDFVTYSPDGEQIAIPCRDGTVRLWDSLTGQEVLCWKPSTNWIYGTFFSPDGRRLAVTGLDGFSLWDAKAGTRLELRELPEFEGAPTWVMFDPKRDQVFIGETEGSAVRICDLRTGKELRRYRLRGIAGGGDLSQDGRRLVIPSSKALEVGYDKGVLGLEVWDTENHRRTLTVEAQSEPLRRASLVGKQTRLITFSFDLEVHQSEAFPWQSSAYPNSDRQPLMDRVQAYARTFWKDRLAHEEAPQNMIRVRTPRSTLWPAREQKVGPDQVDLSRHYNALLTSTFVPFYNQFESDNDLAALPQGAVQFEGVSFDVRGVIQLRKGGVDLMRTPWQVSWERYPARVGDIAIEREIERIHVVYGVAGKETSGKVVANLIWRYGDGAEEVSEVIYGRDVRSWWFMPGDDADRDLGAGLVAWRGSNPRSEEFGQSLRLYLRTWENPRPSAVVRSIDFASALTEVAPFLIAITVE